MEKDFDATQLNLDYEPILEPTYYHDTGDRGFFAILYLPAPGDRPKQNSYPLQHLPDVLRLLPRNRDTWIVQNDFFRPNRRLVNLLRINSCFADLDYYKTEQYKYMYSETVYKHVLFYCELFDIPIPSIILNSGRGLQIKWILENPLPAQALPRWKAVQTYLVRLFESFGADKQSKDCSRVLRLERTVNTKNNTIVKVLYPSNMDTMRQYSFDYLADKILPYSRDRIQSLRQADKERRAIIKPNARAIIEPNKIVRTQKAHPGLQVFNPYQLNWDRSRDVRKLANLRHGSNGIPDGYRDIFTFLETCFLSWMVEPENLYREVMEVLVQEFIPTWDYRKTQGKISSVYERAKKALKGIKINYKGKQVDPRYRYSNQTIIELLEIIPDEERQLSTIISQDEAKRRDRERKREQRQCEPREQYLLKAKERKEQVKKYREQGLSYKEIGERLNITVNSVDKLLRE